MTPARPSSGAAAHAPIEATQLKARLLNLVAALALLLTGCEGQETAKADWVALPVTLSDGGVIRLIGVDSGLCLEIAGSGYSDRDAAQLGECADSSQQQFRLAYKSAGHFQLVSGSGSRCLDVDSASMKAEAGVFQWLCGENTNQQILLRNRGSVTQLEMRHSGMCLDAKGGGRAPGTPIIQWPCTGADNQLFRIESLARPKPRP